MKDCVHWIFMHIVFVAMCGAGALVREIMLPATRKQGLVISTSKDSQEKMK